MLNYYPAPVVRALTDKWSVTTAALTRLSNIVVVQKTSEYKYQVAILVRISMTNIF